MDPILQTLLSWQFILFGMSIAAVMFVVRKIAEYAMANWAAAAKESKLWNELILPIMPVVLGPVVAFLFKTFPYPNGLVTSGGRVLFGLVAGLLSTLLYRVIKALLFQKINAPANQYPGYSAYPAYPVQPGIAQAGVITPDNPVDPEMEALAGQVRQTIKKD